MPDAYYWPHHRAAGLPPPEDFEIDFATRCWQCKAIRCHCGTGGQWVDDVFMCRLCIRRFDLT